MTTTGGTLQRRVVRLTPASAIWIVGVLVGLVVARRVFVAAHRPLSWAAASAVAAVVLDPYVESLARRIRRLPAVLLTFAAVAVIGVGTTYLVFDDVQQALDRLQAVAPEAADAIEAREDRLGELARDGRLRERVDSFVTALEERATGGSDVLRSTAGTAPTYFLCAILTVFFLNYGPRTWTAALAQVRDRERRQRIEAIASMALERTRRAVVLTVGVALLLGLIGTSLANWLDLPAPSALGFAIFVMALLPHVGLVVGSIPLLLLTVGFRSGATAIVLAVAVVAVQLVDSWFVRNWIAQRSVHIGLLVPWVVALLGYAIYGIGAAAYGTIAAVFVLAVVDQVQVAHQVSPTPQD